MNLTDQYERDYKKFCLKCNFNDCDYGCTCRSGEEVYQCDMYRHYHPEEVKQFEKDMEEWQKQSEYQKQEKREFAISELEKIKAEIQYERSKHSGEGKYTYTAGLKVSIDIIDKCIAELKGDNNGQNNNKNK